MVSVFGLLPVSTTCQTDSKSTGFLTLSYPHVYYTPRNLIDNQIDFKHILQTWNCICRGFAISLVKVEIFLSTWCPIEGPSWALRDLWWDLWWDTRSLNPGGCWWSSWTGSCLLLDLSFAPLLEAYSVPTEKNMSNNMYIISTKNPFVTCI